MKYILDGHKLYWHADRVNAWLKGERIAPITIDMALTRSCNYKCVYCYSQLQENERKQLTWPVLCEFLDDCVELGIKAISLVSDGESTCHADWVNFIIAGKARGIDMALGTNGGLISKRDLLQVMPQLTYIRFNISASGPDKYSEIHGTTHHNYFQAIAAISTAVNIKKQFGLKTTIGLQMVLLPSMIDDIIPLTQLGKILGVDYLVIKHCSDDENGTLGVDYSAYKHLFLKLAEAESMSTDKYKIVIKWSKITAKGKRSYSKCFGPPFIMQLSGSGLVAPCGMLFNDKYSEYHIGNIVDTSFKDLFNSERYWEVMKKLHTMHDAKTMCGSLCLQHSVNKYLDWLRTEYDNGGCVNAPSYSNIPEHINFI